MTPARTNQNWLPGIFNEILGDNWLAERRSTTAPLVLHHITKPPQEHQK